MATDVRSVIAVGLAELTLAVGPGRGHVSCARPGQKPGVRLELSRSRMVPPGLRLGLMMADRPFSGRKIAPAATACAALYTPEASEGVHPKVGKHVPTRLAGQGHAGQPRRASAGR